MSSTYIPLPVVLAICKKLRKEDARTIEAMRVSCKAWNSEIPKVKKHEVVATMVASIVKLMTVQHKRCNGKRIDLYQRDYLTEKKRHSLHICWDSCMLTITIMYTLPYGQICNKELFHVFLHPKNASEKLFDNIKSSLSSESTLQMFSKFLECLDDGKDDRQGVLNVVYEVKMDDIICYADCWDIDPWNQWEFAQNEAENEMLMLMRNYDLPVKQMIV